MNNTDITEINERVDEVWHTAVVYKGKKTEAVRAWKQLASIGETGSIALDDLEMEFYNMEKSYESER